MEKCSIQRLLLLCICCFVTELALGKQNQTLPYFTSTYSATIKGIDIKAIREFKPLKDDLSELHFRASSWIASLEESSQFSWDTDKIKPIRFTQERNLLGKQQKKTLTFDRQNQQIVSTSKDKTYIIPNTDDALDALSFQLQLQYDLLNNQGNTSYSIADKKNLKTYRFEILGDEQLQTKVGKLDAIKVKVIGKNNKRLTYFWLAKDWYHLLVRLEQYKEGKKEFEIQLTSAEIGGQTVSGTQH